MSDLAFIDTSAYQHPNGAAIDWAAVKASGVVGVYVKLTEGGALDPWGKRDVVAASAAGLHVGVYHFSRPDLNSASAEAASFNSARRGLPCDLPPALDTETQPITLQWNQQFIQLVGDDCIGYTFRSALGSLSFLPSSRIWIAWPNGTRGGYLGLQYGYGPVPGIQGAVDLDWFDPSIVPTPQGGSAVGAVKPGTTEYHGLCRNQDGTIQHFAFVVAGGVGLTADENLGGPPGGAIGGLGCSWTDSVNGVLRFIAEVTGTDHVKYLNTYDDSKQAWSGWLGINVGDYPESGSVSGSAPHTHQGGVTGPAQQ